MASLITGLCGVARKSMLGYVTSQDIHINKILSSAWTLSDFSYVVREGVKRADVLTDASVEFRLSC